MSSRTTTYTPYIVVLYIAILYILCSSVSSPPYYVVYIGATRSLQTSLRWNIHHDSFSSTSTGNCFSPGIMDLPPSLLSLPLKDRVQTIINALLHDPEYAFFDSITLGGVELLSISQETQSVRFAFTVLPTLCNGFRTLHGGAATALLDTLPSLALVTVAKPGHWHTLGLTRNLTVTFLRPLPLGTQVFLDCEVVTAGKLMANLKGTMKTGDGRVCVICIHDKTVVETHDHLTKERL